jgi:hypothetical protein
LRKFFMVALICLFALSFPATAAAADAVPNSLLVSLWPEYSDNQVFFMQQVELAANEALPATVRFSFPSGIKMQWTGEIMGADVAKDIQATPTITQKDGYDEIAITLTKSRIGQAEAVWDGLKVDGQNRTLKLDWIQRYDSRTTTFEFLQPSQSSNVVMTPKPAGTRQNQEGFTFHDTAPKRIPVGQSETFSVTYTRAVNTPSVNDATSSGAANTQPSGAAQNPVNPWVLVLLFVVAAIGGGVYIYWETSKGGRTAGLKDSAKPVSGKKSGSSVKKPPRGPNMKTPIIALIIIGVALGSFAVYSFSNASPIPSGSNCEENAAYLKKGADAYKADWGKYPTDLKQLLVSKDGKGPYVETISLKCPSDGTYYAIDSSGNIVSSESTEAP